MVKTIDITELKPATNTELHLRGRIRSLESENGRLRRELGNQEVFASAVAETVVAADPFPPVKYTHTAKKRLPLHPSSSSPTGTSVR